MMASMSTASSDNLLSPSSSGQANTWLAMSEKAIGALSLSHSWAGFAMSQVLELTADVQLLKTSSGEMAAQLTKLDEPVFKSIRRDELLSCGWNGVNKNKVAQNIVQFTRRFNKVSFWVVEEILSKSSNGGVDQAIMDKKSADMDAKSRGEVITQFIKIAKKLIDDYNNLHSAYAIISTLNSSPIFRLNRSWSHVHQKYMAAYDKMKRLFSDEANFKQLRAHCDRKQLPCIPYLGMYLKDLIYVHVAHPLPSHSRDQKMNQIVDMVEYFQQSRYDIDINPSIREYLERERYIEELQKFLEDTNYKLSLKLEPPIEHKSSLNSKQHRQKATKSTFYVNSHDINCSARSACPSPSVEVAPLWPGSTASMPNYASITRRASSSSLNGFFVPGHRKSRSLGTSTILDQLNISMDSRQAKQRFSIVDMRRRCLIDDSLIEEHPCDDRSLCSQDDADLIELKLHSRKEWVHFAKDDS